MLFGMSYRMLGMNALVFVGVLYIANTLSARNASVARIFRRNGITATPISGGVTI